MHYVRSSNCEARGRLDKFIEYKKAGISFNAEVRNRMDYRNPYFLLHAVRYQDADQIGSCFDNDVFDPHGYDPSDYYDEIEAEMRCDSDRKELEKKKAQKFAYGDVTNRDGRQNKKSKWDKVDGDRENPLPFGGQDSGCTGGVHAAILSAANAGSSGYMLFAQQKRQEAEEKRSTEREGKKVMRYTHFGPLN
ncbi:hypothetical protein K1719_041202 [Acacia pycnantha]|nr:hypothetical protein K1719_041202 [Acacia pycnantha]